MPGDPDAVVIGAGPNGLVAANVLADAGWDVLVLEAQPEPGGAVQSAELTIPGFTHDVFSSFYPFAVVSPAMRSMALEDYGVRWRRAPLALAHPTPDGRCAVLSTNEDETAASLDAYASGDGAAWRELRDTWRRLGPHLVCALMGPFPPVRPGLRLGAAVGPRGIAAFSRFALLPVRRLAAETFAGEGGGLLLAGNAMHTDLAPEATLSGMFGWLLACLGADVGFPVVEGGSRNLADALVRRLTARGGRVECAARVNRVVLRGGRAVAVTTSDGREVSAGRAVLAAVDAPRLLLDLVGADHLPPAVVRDLRRFEWDAATVKVDWALQAPIPWSHDDARRAGTVHVADSMDELTKAAAALATRQVPDVPPMVIGQYSVADPTRSPAGADTAWAYTHVPRTGAVPVERVVEAMEGRMEQRAPGFRDLVLGRHVLGPADLEARDANLSQGAVNAGTAQLHQQVIFRPTPGRGGAATVIPGLYLASASAHPGGGVHGACGANAARAALRAAGPTARALRTLSSRAPRRRP